MTTMNEATPQDSEMHIFGAGIPSYYEWWHSFDREREHQAEFPFDAPDDWMYTVVAEDPETDGKTIRKEIRHSNIMQAARKIIEKGFDANSTIKSECRNLLFDVDAADLDAVIADAVLQVAVYGDIIFG